MPRTKYLIKYLSEDMFGRTWENQELCNEKQHRVSGIKRFIMKKNKKRTPCTAPIGLADKNGMKYKLSYEGSLIYLNTPEEDGYEPYPVRFYILAQIIDDYGLDYVCIDNQGKENRMPAIMDKHDMLKCMEGSKGCVFSINDGRVYAFVALGEIISDVESIGIEDMAEGNYVVHPLTEFCRKNNFK